ncbi:unnamed protein product [Rhodiola kirilowii]
MDLAHFQCQQRVQLDITCVIGDPIKSARPAIPNSVLGEDIFISIWNLHRSPTNWNDADKFNPERWPLDGPNPNETNQNFSYLPFGGGPRKCVGDMFATFEV